MRKLLTTIFILTTITAGADIVMRHDGQTSRGPMPLPRTAQARLDGGGTVSSLAGADWTTRNACGYFEAIEAIASTGMVITATAWPLAPSNGVFRQTIVEEITLAEYAARQKAAQMAQLQALIDMPVDPETPALGTAGDQIRQLEGIVEWFISQGVPLPRPVNTAAAVPMINAYIEAQEEAENWALTSKANRYGTTLAAALAAFKERGITTDQIYAAWQYMKATGQDVEPTE